MNLFQTEGSAESNAMFRDLCDRGRSFSSGSTNARNVKENHLVTGSKAVGYARIPAVHVGVEVPQKEQRNFARFAESAVGVTDAIGLNKLCGDRFVRVIVHRLSPSNLIPIGLSAFDIPFVQTKYSAEGDRCGATGAGQR